LSQNRSKFLACAACLCLGWQVSARAGIALYFDADQATPGMQGGIADWSSQNWYNGTTWTGWNSSALDLAVFSGPPGGSVTIRSSAVASGLQFDASGYTISGTASRILTLSSGTIAVADGVTAAITLPLATGSGTGLHKIGGGLVAISSANTINSNITIEGGTLSIAADGAFGSTANDISLSGGGALRLTGSQDFVIPNARQVTIGAGGGRFDTAGANITLNGVGQLTGSGALIKSGTKSLVFGSSNIGFSGSISVLEGILAVRSGAAVGGGPIALSGGSLTLAGDTPTNFGSDISVSANAVIQVESLGVSTVTYAVHSVGTLSVNTGTTLDLNGLGTRWLSASSVQNEGVIKLALAGLEVRGALTGSGQVRFGVTNISIESMRIGLIFTGGGSRTIGTGLAAEDAVAGKIILATTATPVIYNGTWQGGGAAQESYAVIHDGGNITLGTDARLNLVTTDLTSLRTLHAWGNGLSNTFEIATGFIADRTVGGTIPEGLGGLEIKDATLITRASAGLPVVTKLDGQGATHRAGLITFIGTTAKWQTASAAQTYDGGVRFDTSATIQTDQDLTHTGTTSQKWDGQWQVPTAGITLTKTGPAWLTLETQGYVAGTALMVNEGSVRFTGDAGAGWYEGNYARGANAAITAPPTPDRTLAVNVGSAAAVATVEFAAPLNQLASLTIGATGIARVTDSPSVGEKAVVATSLGIAAGGVMDLRNNRLIINYDALASSPLSALEAMVLRGRAGGPPGTLWQGDGITSNTAAAAPGNLAVGIAEATEVMSLTGNQSAAWGTATVDASSVLLRLTLAGDSDLDGAVNLNDLIRLANHYGSSTNQHWSGGDFDYDGAVTLNDLIILANNYGSTLTGAAPLGAETFAGDLASVMSGASVPEPGVGWVIGLLTFGLGRRRRKS